jgi:hypothetical protein
MYRGTQFDSLSEGCMPDVTVSKMHACGRATPMRYKHLRCKSCEIYASIPSLVVLHKLASRRGNKARSSGYGFTSP